MGDRRNTVICAGDDEFLKCWLQISKNIEEIFSNKQYFMNRRQHICCPINKPYAKG